MPNLLCSHLVLPLCFLEGDRNFEDGFALCKESLLLCSFSLSLLDDEELCEESDESCSHTIEYNIEIGEFRISVQQNATYVWFLLLMMHVLS